MRAVGAAPGPVAACGLAHDRNAPPTGASDHCPPLLLDLVSIARERMAGGPSGGASRARSGSSSAWPSQTAAAAGAAGSPGSELRSSAEVSGAARPPLALIVDHGLRVESAAEAAGVAAQAEGFGMQVRLDPLHPLRP